LLLQLNQPVIQLRIELVALLQHVLELSRSNDRFVELTKELCFSGVLLVLVNQRNQRLAVLSDGLADVLPLGFKFIVFSEMAFVP
jgi:hypothetical protein